MSLFSYELGLSDLPDILDQYSNNCLKGNRAGGCQNVVEGKFVCHDYFSHLKQDQNRVLAFVEKISKDFDVVLPFLLASTTQGFDLNLTDFLINNDFDLGYVRKPMNEYIVNQTMIKSARMFEEDYEVN